MPAPSRPLQPRSSRPSRAIALACACAGLLLVALAGVPGSARAAAPVLATSGATATASSGSAAAAIDGSAATTWTPTSRTTSQWLQVDLGAPHDLRRVVVAWSGTASRTSTVEASLDGRSWTAVAAARRASRAATTTEDLLVHRARFVRLRAARASAGTIGVRELQVFATRAPSSENLAREAVVTSSRLARRSSSEFAIDGSVASRTTSIATKAPWIQLELGEEVELDRVILRWGSPAPRSFVVATSVDGSEWTTAFEAVAGRGGTNEVEVGEVARLVRIAARNGRTARAMSLREVELYEPSRDQQEGGDEQSGEDDGDGDASGGTTGGDGGTPDPGPQPDTSSPTAPGNSTATPLGQTSVQVGWLAATDDRGVTSYRVFRDGVLRQTIAAPATGWTDSGLAAGTTYRYVVRAVDAAGNVSVASNDAVATTTSPPPPPPPADTTAPTVPGSVSATAQSTTSIQVSWAASTDAVGVTEYRVFRGGVLRQTVTAPTTMFLDTGLTPATAYQYTVRAADAAGNVSAASIPASATTHTPADTTPPTVPGGVTAAMSGATGATVTWTASSDAVGVTQYVVRRDGAPVATISAPTTTFTDSGLDPDRAYAYDVAARDAAGNASASSPTASMRTFNPPGANLPIRYDLASLAGTVYYVATTGSDANAGTSSAAPLATLTAAVAKVSSGQTATIVVRGGTYRNHNRVQLRTSRTIHVRAWPGEVPTFNGAQPFDGGWTAEGALAWRAYTPQPVTDGHGISFTTGENLTGDFVGRHPDQVWIGATQLRQVMTQGQIVDGTFWVDQANARLYLTAADAARPGIEVSDEDVAFVVSGAGDTVQGLRFTRYSNSANDYGIFRVDNTADDAVIRNVEISGAAFNAVTLTGGTTLSTLLDRALFEDVTIEDANWMGLSSLYANDLVLRRMLIQRMNAFQEFTTSPQSGAIKTSRNRTLLLQDSIIRDNQTHGVWFDQSNVDMNVVGNRIENNKGNGVFFEISDDLLMVDNYIRAYAGQSAPVKIAGSSGAKLVNNTFVGGNDVIGVYTDSRSKPECRDAANPCAESWGGDHDTIRPPVETLDWMPRIDLMLNNVVAHPTGATYCGGATTLCITSTNGTAVAPIETILHQADPARGIPQTRFDGNVYVNGASGRLAVVSSGSSTTLSAWISRLAASPISLAGQEAAGKSGTTWVNADGTPTAALTAADSQAAPVPTDPEINAFVPAGTRHYGMLRPALTIGSRQATCRDARISAARRASSRSPG